MHMSKLFNGLASEGMLNDWAEILDWLFDDNRFSPDNGWTSGYVGAFIKKVKRIPNIGDSNYSYESIKKLNIPEHKTSTITIMHSKSDGESRDLVRHIRNGIAHGRATLSKPKGELHIEIRDINRQGDPVAYIFIPVNHLKLIFEAYKQVEKSKNNSLKKIRKIRLNIKNN